MQILHLYMNILWRDLLFIITLAFIFICDINFNLGNFSTQTKRRYLDEVRKYL